VQQPGFLPQLQHAAAAQAAPQQQQQQLGALAAPQQQLGGMGGQVDINAIMLRLDRLTGLPAAAEAGLTEGLVDSFSTLYFFRLEHSIRQGVAGMLESRMDQRQYRRLVSFMRGALAGDPGTAAAAAAAAAPPFP
jgi:hypothetical protein